MSMVTNENLKAALVSRLKGIQAVTTLLASPEEVRETDYQGTTFGYPCVRVRVVRNERMVNCFHEVQVGVQVFSEQDSSREADTISGIIASNLNDDCFAAEGITLAIRITNLMPAVRMERQTWRSETLYKGIAS